ncbi:MAG: glycosyltransferase family 2 protein [Methylovulum sp.]|nr:glycosyltransferase family 2 protein [Methylovulum sp.]
MKDEKKIVYVIILNWNGWIDTIECLESIFQLKLIQFKVIVCDNASNDNSLDKISNWADGVLNARKTEFINMPLAIKPIQTIKISRSDVEYAIVDQNTPPLILIDNTENLGFAGGCNVGVRYALKDLQCSHVWLLNNDTVVDENALEEMIKMCNLNPSIGICGSQVRYYHAPNIIQTLGGKLNTWLCTTHTLFGGKDAASIITQPTEIDFVPGASMLVTRQWLEQVGLMSEEYFLYFEEIDWAERGKNIFNLAVCIKSIVYHRGGASIGNPSESGERGMRSEYYLLRGRLMFAHKFYRSRLLIVYFGMFGSILKRLLNKKWKRAGVACCVLLGIRPKSINIG